MSNLSILGVVAGISVAASLFLATYFLFAKTKDKYIYRILGLLFIAVGLRTAKSILFFIFHSIDSLGLAIGYFALACIGPLLYIYMRSSTENKSSYKEVNLLHGILPLIGTVVCLFTRLEVITILYKVTTALLLFYLLKSFSFHVKSKYKNQIVKRWNKVVLISMLIIWLSFVYQHLTESILDYAIGAGLASLPIYYLFINTLRSPVVFYKTSNKQLPEEIVNRIKKSFEEDKIYLKSGISLVEFSKIHEIPVYLITKAVKHLYGKSFPESINHFRVEEVKEKLQDENYYNEKIERIAFEVGFNSPSVFYTVFKKITSLSPKKFKEIHYPKDI